MKTSDIKKIIQQFAREEFELYPESFRLHKGGVASCRTENISQWAMNMWESRSDEEIKRDFHFGLHPDNYIAWAFEEFRKIDLKPQ